MTRRLAIIAAVIASATLAGCGSEAQKQAEIAARFRPVTPGVLRVGTVLGRPPLVYARTAADVQRTPANLDGPGYEVDLVDQIAQRLDLRVRWVAVPSAADLVGPRCRCDMGVAGVADTPAARRRFAVTNPYLTVVNALVVGSSESVSDLAAARALRLGAVAGSESMETIRQQIQPTSSPRAFPTRARLLAAVTAGRIDGAVMSVAAAVAATNASNGALQVAGDFPSDERYVVVLRRGSPDAELVSETIEELRREGFLDVLRAKYFPDELSQPALVRAS